MLNKLSKDSFLVGVAVGVLTPLMIYVAAIEINEWLVAAWANNNFGGFDQKFRSILSVFSNLLPFAMYKTARKDNAMRGVMLPTFGYAVFILIYYFGWDLLR